MPEFLTVYDLVLYYIVLYSPYILIAVSGVVVIWLFATKSFTRRKFLRANFYGEAKEVIHQKVFEKDLLQEGKNILFVHKIKGAKSNKKQKYEVINDSVYYDKGKPNLNYKFGSSKPINPTTWNTPDNFTAEEIASIADTAVWKDLLSSIFSRKEMIILFLIIINMAATAINVYFTYDTQGAINRLIGFDVKMHPITPVGVPVEIPVKP